MSWCDPEGGFYEQRKKVKPHTVEVLKKEAKRSHKQKKL